MATNSSSTSTSTSMSTTAESNALDTSYSLHPSDNHESLITHVILKGDNYSEWTTKF